VNRKRVNDKNGLQPKGSRRMLECQKVSNLFDRT
jgi:hypothetical protein